MHRPVAAAVRRRRPGPRGGRTGSAGPEPSRRAIFAAAAREFAAHGFDGASVDRIAAAARLNKAMIYYHFGSKGALYSEILHDMFGAVAARVRELAESAGSPEAKIRRFVEVIAIEAEARPHFPPIWFREIADGGIHLGEAATREVVTVVRILATLIQEGVRAGAFENVSPLLVHAGIVAPLLLFFATRPLRERIERAGVPGAAGFAREEVVSHIQNVTMTMLRRRPPRSSVQRGKSR
jgi:AcrR family transcriptional regulator